MTHNTALFKPYNNQPKLPYRSGKPNPNYGDFVQAAWHVYWTWAEREARKHHCSVWEARQYVHAKGKLPRQRDRNKRIWSTNDYLAEFMMQFEEWQMRRYDLQRLHEVDLARDNRNTVDRLMRDRNASAFLLLEDMSYGRRESLIDHLKVTDRWNEINALKKDPIYGNEARVEISRDEWRRSFVADEVFRIAALPENFQQIDRLISEAGPSSYKILYPYESQLHPDIPNGCCLLADGCGLVYLEVLDPEACTRFRLAHLSPAWWYIGSKGEYDFDFNAFGVYEGMEFDFAKLCEILQAGVVQINTRHDRVMKRRKNS